MALANPKSQWMRSAPNRPLCPELEKGAVSMRPAATGAGKRVSLVVQAPGGPLLGRVVAVALVLRLLKPYGFPC